MSRAGIRPDIAERVLGHVISGVEGVYDRHAYFEEKADALAKLAALIEIILNPPADNVRQAASPGGEVVSGKSKDEYWTALVFADPITFKVKRTVFMIGDASEDERTAFCEALLETSWLPPKALAAIRLKLGPPPFKRKTARFGKQSRTTTLVQIAECEALSSGRTATRVGRSRRDAAVAKHRPHTRHQGRGLKKRIQRCKSRQTEQDRSLAGSRGVGGP